MTYFVFRLNDTLLMLITYYILHITNGRNEPEREVNAEQTGQNECMQIRQATDSTHTSLPKEDPVAYVQTYRHTRHIT